MSLKRERSNRLITRVEQQTNLDDKVSIMGDFNNVSAMIRALKEGGKLAALTGGDPHNLHTGRFGAWKAKIQNYAKQINSSTERSLFIFSKTNWFRKRANDVIEWK